MPGAPGGAYDPVIAPEKLSVEKLGPKNTCKGMKIKQ